MMFTKFILILILRYFCRVLWSVIWTKFKRSVIFIIPYHCFTLWYISRPLCCFYHITAEWYDTWFVHKSNVTDPITVECNDTCTYVVQIFSYNNAVEFYNTRFVLSTSLLLFILPYYCWISGSMICTSVRLTI